MGRVLVGLGIGVSAVVVPAYLGELSPAQLRGRIVELYEVALCIGMLAAVLMDAGLAHVENDWRWMVGMPALPGLLMSGKPPPLSSRLRNLHLPGKRCLAWVHDAPALRACGVPPPSVRSCCTLASTASGPSLKCSPVCTRWEQVALELSAEPSWLPQARHPRTTTRKPHTRDAWTMPQLRSGFCPNRRAGWW